VPAINVNNHAQHWPKPIWTETTAKRRVLPARWPPIPSRLPPGPPDRYPDPGGLPPVDGATALPITSLNDDGNLYLIVGPDPTTRSHVLSGILKAKSSFFRNMLGPNWKEGQRPATGDWIVPMPT
jgi:hypothetical protein